MVLTKMKELLLKMVALLITIISVVVVMRVVHHPGIMIDAWKSFTILYSKIETHWWFLLPILLLPVFLG
jgi:hypothetical protein